MTKNKSAPGRFRQRYYVDTEVQFDLLKRIVYYGLASILFLTLPIAFAKTLSEPDIFFIDHIGNVFRNHWPVLMMAVFFIPFAMNDVLKFSNRFVGPIYRIRAELKNFEIGGKLKPIAFRDDDYWHDLASGLNKIRQRLNELEELHGPEPESEPESEELEDGSDSEPKSAATR